MMHPCIHGYARVVFNMEYGYMDTQVDQNVHVYLHACMSAPVPVFHGIADVRDKNLLQMHCLVKLVQ